MTGRVYPTGWPIESDWTARLDSHFLTPGFKKLSAFVDAERNSQTIYPTAANVFTAFRLTSFAATKVVILGQDPYHGPGQAHGLSFSVEGELKLPPSLRNIFRELADDWLPTPPTTGNLTAWARHGVFMLNTVLTVREGQANSHRNQGWEQFTDEVIAQLNEDAVGIVFILWGKPAEKKAERIDRNRHAILIAPHPSPLSAHRGFFGSAPFSKANDALRKFGKTEVDWRV